MFCTYREATEQQRDLKLKKNMLLQQLSQSDCINIPVFALFALHLAYLLQELTNNKTKQQQIIFKVYTSFILNVESGYQYNKPMKLHIIRKVMQHHSLCHLCLLFFELTVVLEQVLSLSILVKHKLSCCIFYISRPFTNGNGQMVD